MLFQAKYIVQAFLLFVILISCVYLFSSVNFLSKPTKFYHGITTDSNINADTSKQYKEGKKAFYKCSSYHILFKNATGPDLIEFTKRGPWTNKKNVWSYLRNPLKFYQEDKSGYMKILFKKYPARSPAFLLNEKEVNDIIYYIEAEGKNRKTSN